MIHLVACSGDLDVDDFSYTSIPTMLLNHHNHRRSQLLLTPPFLFVQFLDEAENHGRKYKMTDSGRRKPCGVFFDRDH